MTNPAQPTFFLSHGGGPWPWIDGMREQYAQTSRAFAGIPPSLPARPRAVLMMSGHWEAADFTVVTSPSPPMVYDYFGFPEHTYRIRYPAAGDPALASRVRSMLAQAGFACVEDPERGFDHGAFVPLQLMYPKADVPVVMLSMRADYDPRAHLDAGRVLAPLRDDGVLIVGSGLSYHDMRGFGRPESTAVASGFERWLGDTVAEPDPVRRSELLQRWADAPFARRAHPREDHLVPLMFAAGAARADAGTRLVVDTVMEVAMASYRFG
ncbi:MAG: class III extradiol ring-cleavage dioxygenase [Lautropia sp.]